MIIFTVIGAVVTGFAGLAVVAFVYFAIEERLFHRRNRLDSERKG